MPFCRECGNQISEGDTFCKQCGAAQMPEPAPETKPPEAQPPAEPGAAAAPAASNKTAIYLLISILAFVVTAGVVVGIIFGVRGCSKAKAVENADKYVSEALSYVNEVDEIEDDLIENTKALDLAAGSEQFKSDATRIQTELKSAISNLDNASSTLAKVDRPKLPDWWDTYISLLEKANEEKRQAYEEWDEFITRIIEIDVFNDAYQAMVASYIAALDTLNAAGDQHDSEALDQVAGGFANGKTTSYAALDLLVEARVYLEQCKQLEPSIDLSEFENAFNTVESWVYDFQRACDLGNAGMLDEHSALVDQIRPTFNAFPRDISFDIVSWFEAERDSYIQRIEQHFANEAEYRRRAAEVWNQNNP